MPNTLTLHVEEPDQILASTNYDAGAVLRVHWCATETGAYASLTTVPIVTGVRAYTVYDTAGTASTWYRTRYENSGATITSDWSASFQAGDETAGRLCSLSDVKQRLAITDATDDEILAEIIDQVTDEITSVTGRSFAPDPLSGSKTVYLDYPADGDGMTLYLPRGIRSATYLGYASTDQPDAGSGTYAEIPTASYWLDPPAHSRSAGWPATRVTLSWSGGYRFYAGRRTVKLTGSFGWSAVPAAIRAIAEMLVVSSYRARGSGGLTSYTVGVEGERTYQRMLTTADIKTLKWYSEAPVP
jgi:hypothetical protein